MSKGKDWKPAFTSKFGKLDTGFFDYNRVAEESPTPNERRPGGLPLIHYGRGMSSSLGEIPKLSKVVALLLFIGRHGLYTAYQKDKACLNRVLFELKHGFTE